MQKIEQSRTKEGERLEKNKSESECRRGRLGAGIVGGWVGGFGNAERTSCVLLLVKQRYDFCESSIHSLSSISCKKFHPLRSACVEGTQNQFKSNLL